MKKERMNSPCIYARGYPYKRDILEKKLGRPIRPGYLACHICDNGRCKNPEHIYEGTYWSNTQDRITAMLWEKRRKRHRLRGKEYWNKLFRELKQKHMNR